MLLRKATFGFLVAPVSFGLVMFVMSRSLAEGFLYLAATAMIGYPLGFLIGVPLFVLFRRIHWNGLTAYLAAGMGFAFLLSAAFVVIPNHYDAGPFTSLIAEVESLLSTPRLSQIAFISIVCLSSTALFWLIVRPDRENG